MKSIFRIIDVRSANDLVLRQAADEASCRRLFLLASGGIAGSRSGSVELLGKDVVGINKGPSV
jgi:hypothetical protein